MKFNLKNIPLVLIVGFNLFSLLLFYTAPYKWDTNNIYIFLIFALTCQSAIVIGYFIGFNRSNKTKARRHILSRLSDAKLNFIFLFYSLTFLILYAYKLKLDSFDIREMFNFLLIGVADPQLGYSLSIDESRTPPFSWTIYFLISIINNLFFVIGFLKWKDLSKFLKFLFVLFCLLELFFWIGRGTNFGVVSWVTTLSISSLFKLKNIRLNLRQKIKFSLIILILFLATVSSFSYIMYNRAGKKQIDIHYFDLVTSEVDKNGAMLKLLPESLHQTYLYIVAYLCQGYYHTSLAFDLPFKPTFFWGNNPVSVDISRLLGFNKRVYTFIP